MKKVGNFQNLLTFATLLLLSLMMLNPATAADWTPVTSGVTMHLYDVWGISSNEVYAVGEDKSILFFDGSSWTQMDTGEASVTDLVSVWGTSATDIYAAGGATILHYDGTEWTELEGDFTTTISGGIWGSSANDIFFIGNPIKHYDGTTFIDETASASCNRDIWGTSANNVYAVGQLGTIQRYNGSGWSDMETGLGGHTIFGIWGSSATDIFAVANAGVILHYNGSGSTWTEMENPGYYLYEDVWGTSADNVYAVGSVGQTGGIQHYDGIEWLEMVSNTEEDLNGVWVSSDGVVFAVGENGTVLQNGESGSEPPETGTYEEGYADGYADGLANCQDDEPYTPITLDIDNPDAYLTLVNDKYYSLLSGTCTHLYGSSGTNNIILKPNSGARLFSFTGNNTIRIESEFSLFTVSRSGSTVTLEGTNGTILVIAATATSQSIIFSDQTLELVIDIAAGNIMLGDEIIE